MLCIAVAYSDGLDLHGASSFLRSDLSSWRRCAMGSCLSHCKDFFRWLHGQIAGAADLPDPREDWRPWGDLLQFGKKRFAGLVQRAWKHEVLQDYNRCTVKEGYAGFYMALELGNYEFPEEVTTETAPQLPPRADQVHACLKCQRAFCTRTAWALHAFKKHRRINGARRFASGSYCMSCGTEYWEHKRWLLHLRYSGACRRARKAESA